MVFSSDKKISSIFGVTLEEKHRSTKDKWLRKKYMGVWSRALTWMRTMVPRFPATVAT